MLVCWIYLQKIPQNVPYWAENQVSHKHRIESAWALPVTVVGAHLRVRVYLTLLLLLVFQKNVKFLKSVKSTISIKWSNYFRKLKTRKQTVITWPLWLWIWTTNTIIHNTSTVKAGKVMGCFRDQFLGSVCIWVFRTLHIRTSITIKSWLYGQSEWHVVFAHMRLVRHLNLSIELDNSQFTFIH